MKQFRVTGVDNRSNKPLQALVEANDEAHAYMVARSRFSSIDRIEKMASTPAAPQQSRANAGPLGSVLEDDEDDEDGEVPDLSNFDPSETTPRQAGGLKAMLRRFLGHRVGINLDEPDKFRIAKLASVSDDFFTVRVDGSPLLYHFPIRGIISVMEQGSVPAGSAEPQKTPSLFIEVPRTMIYRGVMAAMTTH